MRVSVIFENPQDFIAFYHKGLPRFYLSLPFGEPPSLPDDQASISDKFDAEAKMLSILEIQQEDLAAFEAVIKCFRGRLISLDELDAMEI